jgi:predicted nucleotidyltransferase
VKESILRALAYYDLFAYPLTAKEIHLGLNVFAESSKVIGELQKMEQEGLVFKFDGFYSLRNDLSIITKRKIANEKAQDQLTLAYQKAKFISRFPFIRGICISGSLSKNYADEKSDLDFFIITHPGRLWIARTMFVLIRKIFIAKKNYKNYCLNYFLAEDKLTLEERNLFTATELTTLIPVFGFNNYHNLMKANPWISDFLPNHKIALANPEKTESTLKKRMVEKLLDIGGNRLDKYFMDLTLRTMKKRHQSKFTKEDFALALKTKEYVSKIHLGNNQKRILTLYQQRLSELNVEPTLI